MLQLEAEFFWRDVYKNEVDIVQADNPILPIEIKSSKIETKSILKFMNKYNLQESVIISYDKEEVLHIDNKQIRVIHFYKYLLEDRSWQLK